MAIFRTHKNKNYSTIHNGFLKDPKLSLKAKGLLAYFLSRPDDWEFYTNEIIKNCRDGRDSISSAINELEQLGYIQRDFKRSDGGKFSGGYEYSVFETPQPKQEKPKSENTEIGETRNREKPKSENPTLLSTESKLNTELILSTELQQIDSSSFPNKDIYDFYSKSGFGLLNKTLMEMLDADIEVFGKEWIKDALTEAVRNGKYKLSYAEGILRNWKANGRAKSNKEAKGNGDAGTDLGAKLRDEGIGFSIEDL